VGYIKKNFGKQLSDLLESPKRLLAFDLEEDDDEFNMTR
jgi:hypothetical protein